MIQSLQVTMTVKSKATMELEIIPIQILVSFLVLATVSSSSGLWIINLSMELSKMSIIVAVEQFIIMMMTWRYSICMMKNGIL